MKDLEYCIKCDDPTGNAGEGDGSLYLDVKGPYCDACYFDVIHESHRQLKKENTNLKVDLQVANETMEMLGSEIKRLKQELHESRSGHAILARRVIEIINENERYRKALEEIITQHNQGMVVFLYKIAEEALKQK